MVGAAAAGGGLDFFSPQGRLLLPVHPSGGSQWGTVTVNCCGPDFKLSAVSPDGQPPSWKMRPEDWLAADAPVYSGTIKQMPGMSFTLRWTIGNPYEACGVNRIVVQNGQVMAAGSPAAIHRSLAGPQKRYECRYLLP